MSRTLPSPAKLMNAQAGRLTRWQSRKASVCLRRLLTTGGPSVSVGTKLPSNTSICTSGGQRIRWARGTVGHGINRTQ